MAAGLGTRMRSDIPKHLHPILGRRMVDWVIGSARAIGVDPLVVVAAPATASAFDGLPLAIQEQPLGTGDAVRSARAALDGASDDVLVLSGDTPLLTAEVLRELVEAHRAGGAAATVLSFEPDDAKQYGRVVRGTDGGLAAIVEYRDATEAERAVREVNSSIYVFRADRLWPVLDRLTPHNAQGELYLTDSVALLVEDGDRVAVHKGDDPVEAEGVNTRVELAGAAAALRDRINESHMLAGVTIVDPCEHVDRRRCRDRGRRGDPSVHRHPRLDPHRRPRRDRAARGRRRLDRRSGGERRAVLLPPARHRSRGRGEGGNVRRAQEHPHRGALEGSAPHVPR